MYSLLKEDDDSFHILHPDGNPMVIAKKGLEDDVINRIKAMRPIQYMSDGGMAKDPTVGLSKPDDTIDAIYSALSSKAPPPPEFVSSLSGRGVDDAPKPSLLSTMLQNPKLNAEQAEKLVAEQDTSAPAPTVTPKISDQSKGTPDLTSHTVGTASDPGISSLPAADTRNLGTIPAPQSGGLGGIESKLGVPGGLTGSQRLEAQGILGGAKAEGDLGKAQAGVLENTSSNLDKFMTDMKDRHDRNNTLIDQTIEDFKNQKIDPNRVFANQSTGQNITAGIAILLGGLGQGLIGGKNQALEVIDKAIDRDIDAQKAEAGKKQNLFSMVLSKVKNEDEADAITKSIMLNKAELDGKALAARYQDPIQRNAALQKLGVLGQSATATNLKNIVERSALQLTTGSGQQEGTSGNTGPGIPIGHPIVQLLPKEQQERLVPVNGKYMLAKSNESAKTLSEAQTKVAQLQDTLDEIKKFNDEGGIGGAFQSHNPLSTRSGTAEGLKNRALVQIRKVADIMRLNPETESILNKMVPEPGGFRAQRDEAISQNLQSTIDSELDAFRQNNLLNYVPKFKPKVGKPKL